MNYSNKLQYSDNLNGWCSSTGEYRIDGDKIQVYFSDVEVEYEVDTVYDDYGERHIAYESGTVGSEWDEIFSPADEDVYYTILDLITK